MQPYAQSANYGSYIYRNVDCASSCIAVVPNSSRYPVAGDIPVQPVFPAVVNIPWNQTPVSGTIEYCKKGRSEVRRVSNTSEIPFEVIAERNGIRVSSPAKQETKDSENVPEVRSDRSSRSEQSMEKVLPTKNVDSVRRALDEEEAAKNTAVVEFMTIAKQNGIKVSCPLEGKKDNEKCAKVEAGSTSTDDCELHEKLKGIHEARPLKDENKGKECDKDSANIISSLNPKAGEFTKSGIHSNKSIIAPAPSAAIPLQKTETTRKQVVDNGCAMSESDENVVQMFKTIIEAKNVFEKKQLKILQEYVAQKDYNRDEIIRLTTENMGLSTQVKALEFSLKELEKQKVLDVELQKQQLQSVEKKLKGFEQQRLLEEELHKQSEATNKQLRDDMSEQQKTNLLLTQEIKELQDKIRQCEEENLRVTKEAQELKDMARVLEEKKSSIDYVDELIQTEPDTAIGESSLDTSSRRVQDGTRSVEGHKADQTEDYIIMPCSDVAHTKETLPSVTTENEVPRTTAFSCSPCFDLTNVVNEMSHNQNTMLNGQNTGTMIPKNEVLTQDGPDITDIDACYSQQTTQICTGNVSLSASVLNTSNSFFTPNVEKTHSFVTSLKGPLNLPEAPRSMTFDTLAFKQYGGINNNNCSVQTSQNQVDILAKQLGLGDNWRQNVVFQQCSAPISVPSFQPTSMSVTFRPGVCAATKPTEKPSPQSSTSSLHKLLARLHEKFPWKTRPELIECLKKAKLSFGDQGFRKKNLEEIVNRVGELFEMGHPAQ